MRRNCDDDDLWRELFARRCWGGVAADPHEFSVPSLRGDHVDQSWRCLYKRAVQREAAHVEPYIRHLRRYVPGVLGHLAHFVGVSDEAHRVSVRCGLRRNHILVKHMTDAFDCALLVRQNNDYAHENVWISVEPLPSKFNEELENQLRQLRAVGGTCKPLIDCLRCEVDSSLTAEALIIALRKALGATAVCDGTAEAERVAHTLHCEVVCCQGTRVAEYREGEIPEVRWIAWPSGEELWEPC